MQVSTKIRNLLILIMTLGAAQFAIAQNGQQQPLLINVMQVQMKAGATGNFRSFHRDDINPRAQANGQPWKLMSSNFFGDSFQYAVATPLNNFAQLDGGGDGAASDIGIAAFNNAVDWRRRFVVTTRPDMAIGGGSGVMPLRRMARFQVNQGKIPQFEDFWNDTIKPALEDAGVTGYQVFQTVLGGSQGEFYGGVYIPNFAALDSMNLAAVLNNQEQREFGELVSEFEVTVQRIDTELSFGLPGL